MPGLNSSAPQECNPAEESWKQRERDDRFARTCIATALFPTGRSGNFRNQPRLKLMWNPHLACGDLIVSGANKAELATAEIVALVHADRRAKHTACHRPPFVDVAQAGHGVERGTGSIVGKVFEALLLFIGGSENARHRIARKVGTELCQPSAGSFLDRLRNRRILRAQRFHAGAETQGVKLIDGECSMTALRATGAAGEPWTRASGRIGESQIDDLHQFPVAVWKLHNKKHSAVGLFEWSEPIVTCSAAVL